MRIKRKESGFSVLEGMIATFILSVGILGTLAVFTQAVVFTQHSQEELIARQKVREILESIYTARNTQQITFAMVQNTSNGGIFLDGWQTLKTAGPDGIVGTGDDGAIENYILPGPDGLLGTLDDVNIPLNNFTRQILITPVPRIDGTPNPDLNQVLVTVRYRVGAVTRSYQVGTYVSRFR